MRFEYVLILGGDLASETELGPMTKNRIKRATTYGEGRNAVFFAAAGVWPEHPTMQPMGLLMVKALQESGVKANLIGPDRDFNTRGELRVFVNHVPPGAHKTVISAWWHLPRVRRILRKEWGKEAKKTFTYIGSDEKLTVRLALLECIKWVFTFVPEGMRESMVKVFRKLFGRSSW